MVTTAQYEARRTRRIVTLTTALVYLVSSMVALGLVPVLAAIDPSSRGHSWWVAWGIVMLLVVAALSWLVAVLLLTIGLASGAMHRGLAGLALLVAAIEAATVVWVGVEAVP